MFFAKVYGKDVESTLPLLNLLSFSLIDNVFKLHALQFAHLWHKNQLASSFDNWFQFATEDCILAIHNMYEIKFP